MKLFFRGLISPCLFLSVATSALAQEGPDKQLLFGKWTGTATNAYGDVANTTFELRPDMTFSGAADMNHKPFWSYAGTGRLMVIS